MAPWRRCWQIAMTSSVPFRHIVGKSAREGHEEHAPARRAQEFDPMTTPDHAKAATKPATESASPARHYRVFAHDIEAARAAP
jgi:hypothetical protein